MGGGHPFHTSTRSEQGLEDLHWLFCSSAWLMNEDTLGFSTDRDAGFICFFQEPAGRGSLRSKDPEAFLRLQRSNTKSERAARRCES